MIYNDTSDEFDIIYLHMPIAIFVTCRIVLYSQFSAARLYSIIGHYLFSEYNRAAVQTVPVHGSAVVRFVHSTANQTSTLQLHVDLPSRVVHLGY